MKAANGGLQSPGASYQVTRFNALRHGVLSQFTLLPWEPEDEYRTLLDALISEHQPEGATEEHLVEELAGIIWRKRRLRLAESATCQRGLRNALDAYHGPDEVALVHLNLPRRIEKAGEALTATDEDTAAELDDLKADERITKGALDLLASGANGAYKAALAALRDDTRDWWLSIVENGGVADDDQEEPFTANVDGLRRFLETEVTSWYEARRTELQNRPLIRRQAYGEALNPDRLEGLARYETHLDRKLERTLTVLLRLKELRRAGESE